MTGGMIQLRKRYYTLMGSLPHLPPPGVAERLPINRQRMRQRLQSLDGEDFRNLAIAAELLVWERSPSVQTDADAVRRYRQSIGEVTHTGLRSFLEHMMAQRTIMAALRRKQQGLYPPSREEVWGFEPLASWITRNWNRSDFGLGARFPWIEEARGHLEQGRARELQDVQTRLLWSRLSRIADAEPFSFDAVFAYAARWHLLDRWLAQDPVAAGERFRSLVVEVTHEQDSN